MTDDLCPVKSKAYFISVELSKKRRMDHKSFRKKKRIMQHFFFPFATNGFIISENAIFQFEKLTLEMVSCLNLQLAEIFVTPIYW